MKAFKVFERINFERGSDPRDSMSLGDVKGRLLKKVKEEATQALEEVLDTLGGDGPFYYDEDPTGIKIAIYQDTPIDSKLKLGTNEARYFIEFNVDTEQFFVGWEQEDVDGKWKARQWTSVIPFRIEGIVRANGDIKTIEEAKYILIDYIKNNQPLKGPLNPMKESVNFERGIEPKKSMGIGIEKKIFEFMTHLKEEFRLSSWKFKINKDYTIDIFWEMFKPLNIFDISSSQFALLPSYIKFNRIEGAFAGSFTTKESLKSFPNWVNGDVDIYCHEKPEFHEYEIKEICKINGKVRITELYSDASIKTYNK